MLFFAGAEAVANGIGKGVLMLLAGGFALILGSRIFQLF